MSLGYYKAVPGRDGETIPDHQGVVIFHDYAILRQRAKWARVHEVSVCECYVELGLM